MEPTYDQTAYRATLGLFGLVAGLAFWALGEFVLGQLAQPRLELWISAACLGYFSAALLLSGPVAVGRATLLALLPGLIPSGLMLWASTRYAVPDALADDPFAILAFGVLLSVPLPFFVALDRKAPLDYPTLFNEAWRIVIRGVSAGIFLGVFWGVYMVCNLLLSLVGVTALDRLVDTEVFVFGLSGLVIGIALAVLYELRQYLSPLLLLRLLQLLLIPVTAVVVVFVVRVPLEGMDQVFSGFSASATLFAMTLGLATLITSALDCEPSRDGMSVVVRWTVQIACLLMPVLAILGAHALWIRIDGFGWTPARVAAACVCVMALFYGVFYSVPVLLRQNWDARIRRANIWGALLSITIAALALTPALNAMRISAESQFARYENGAAEARELPLRQMAQSWGHAGQDALARLDAQADRDLQILLEDARELRFNGPVATETLQESREALARLLPVVPDGSDWPVSLWDGVEPNLVRDWLSVCRSGAERCVALRAEMDPSLEGDEMLVVLARGDALVSTVMIGRNGLGDVIVARDGRQLSEDGRNLVRAVRNGEIQLAAPPRKALVFGETMFFPRRD